MRKQEFLHIFIFLGLGIFITSCGASGDDTGTEFAPNMYHSVPYEPLKQITEESTGAWLSSRDDEYGEYYNSNPYNPYNMNVRRPPENTVRRTEEMVLPYRIPADSLQLAATVLTNPIDSTESIIQDGQVLYNRFCLPCHGTTGAGDGAVGQVYMGVPAFNKGRVATVSEGHIFHVITYGQGRMGAYGGQIEIPERWKIVEYVQSLQQQ